MIGGGNIKGFKLDDKGDVVIKDGKITMVDGNELLKQTIRTVLGTNQGEWFLNTSEGLNYGNILTKNPDFDVIRNEIISGLKQVDSSLKLAKFDYNFDKQSRKLVVKFTAQDQDGETVSGEYVF